MPFPKGASHFCNPHPKSLSHFGRGTSNPSSLLSFGRRGWGMRANLQNWDALLSKAHAVLTQRRASLPNSGLAFGQPCPKDWLQNFSKSRCSSMQPISPSPLATPNLKLAFLPVKQARRRASSVLSVREQEVLQLIVDGCRTSEIAKRLHLSQNTVKVHVRNIFNKFGVNDRVQMVVHAFRNDLVH
ncbi:response regulator transcription factor [Thermoleptolyngbya oregonensis NK1-22]|nr:response regulator transcription factor [Thermoleptolyngbya oregonensis NK1-22]